MFNIDKWTNIDKTLEQRNNLLVSIFSVIGIVFTSLQLINAIYHKLQLAVIINSGVILILIAVYVINEKQNHNLAKILLLVSINCMLFIFASIVPKSMGIYFLFFPVIAVSALIFNPNQQITRNTLVVLSLLSFIILEVTDYHIFGEINIHKGVINNNSYYINLFTSLGILVFVLIYIIEIKNKVEIKRRQISNELYKSNESLQKTNTELDHFVYSASHDLKAPLSSILGLVNLGKIEIEDKKAKSYFERIEDRINKLNSFIKDIIELSRNSRLELNLKKIDVVELINNSIQNNQYQELSNNIEFRTDVRIKSIIRHDRARLEVIFNNLISNAIKYHKPDGNRYIMIQTEINDTNSSLSINITDNGIGISDDHQKKVFDMFYRAHDHSEGSGLGLYIVYVVVNKLNGKIKLESKENVGTTINIELPTH